MFQYFSEFKMYKIACFGGKQEETGAKSVMFRELVTFTKQNVE